MRKLSGAIKEGWLSGIEVFGREITVRIQQLRSRNSRMRVRRKHLSPVQVFFLRTPMISPNHRSDAVDG